MVVWCVVNYVSHSGFVNGIDGIKAQVDCPIHKTSIGYYWTTLTVVYLPKLRMHIYMNMEYIPCGHQ